jgi:hypothetical protein
MSSNIPLLAQKYPISHESFWPFLDSMQSKRRTVKAKTPKTTTTIFFTRALRLEDQNTPVTMQQLLILAHLEDSPKLDGHYVSRGKTGEDRSDQCTHVNPNSSETHSYVPDSRLKC